MHAAKWADWLSCTTRNCFWHLPLRCAVTSFFYLPTIKCQQGYHECAVSNSLTSCSRINVDWRLKVSCRFGATNIQSFPHAALNKKIKLRTEQMVLLNLNNKISVVYHGSTYVWNSAHNSASAVDQREFPKADCCLVCVVLVQVKEDTKELGALSLFPLLLSPPPSLSDSLSSPHWLPETIGFSCEVVKPSGTSLKRQRSLQMASISLSHANKDSKKKRRRTAIQVTHMHTVVNAEGKHHCPDVRARRHQDLHDPFCVYWRLTWGF